MDWRVVTPDSTLDSNSAREPTMPRPIPDRLSRVLGVTFLISFLSLPTTAPAQRPATAKPPVSARRAAERVSVSAVLTAFLVDSGVRTRGLPWTTGNTLPIKWATPRPVPMTDAYSLQRGFSRQHEGTFLGTLGDSVALGMSITVWGTDSGITSMTIGLDSLLVETKGGGGFMVHREMVEVALKNDGLTLQPLKCKRETEGASYGNLVDAVKAPGKTASGLWWNWDSPQQVPRVYLTLLYRRADMNQVECYSG